MPKRAGLLLPHWVLLCSGCPFKVDLVVDGEAIVVHFYNTTHKVMAHGDKMVRVFYEKTFIPYFERNSHKEAPRIKSLNEQILKGRGDKKGEKQPNPASSNKPQPKKKVQLLIDSDSDF